MVVLFIYYQHLRDRHLKEMRDHGLKEERLMMTIKQSTKDHEMEVSNLKSRFVQMNLALSAVSDKGRVLSKEINATRLIAQQRKESIMYLKSQIQTLMQNKTNLTNILRSRQTSQNMENVAKIYQENLELKKILEDIKAEAESVRQKLNDSMAKVKTKNKELMEIIEKITTVETLLANEQSNLDRCQNRTKKDDRPREEMVDKVA
ncbi:uncharacterized protein LOC143037687 isoform X1 [Oratosquilla oratoria]|uniref:uncharacterized protein LOC143037687 isoform X1 n=1 Tax=Oratosquilla oratoria TaxID=337810 RepID=UPI003F772056